MAALQKVLDGCKRHKVQPGIHCGAPSYAKKMIEMGFTSVTVGGDNRFMTMGGQAALQEVRSGAAAAAAGAWSRGRASNAGSQRGVCMWGFSGGRWRIIGKSLDPHCLQESPRPGGAPFGTALVNGAAERLW